MLLYPYLLHVGSIKEKTLKHTRLSTMLVALAAIVLLVPGAVGARPLADHSAEFKEMQAAIEELAQKSGDEFEIMYINLLIPHHEGAIEMAEMVVNDAPHQEVRDAAAQIIADQQQEINDLTTWLQQWYGQDPNPDQRMMMDQGMMDMMMQMDATMHEKHFLAMMREHHQSAIEIGELALQRATHQELKDQAQIMIDTQREEQEQFATWLQQWYRITPPTPTGDMQDAMEAVMGGMMPDTGAEEWAGWVALAAALALLGSGFVLRRKAVA